MASAKDAMSVEDQEASATYLICVRDRFAMAFFASSWVDMTTKPLRRDALSTVARITQCATVPYLENMAVNSDLHENRSAPSVRRLVRLYVLREGKRKTQDVEVAAHVWVL